MKAKSRLLELDALRGLAAISVVLYHYSTRFNQLFGHRPDYPFNFSLGNMGVHLFFLISGFVIFMTLDKTKSSRDFLISRFSRLYPAYWTAIVLTFSIVAVCTLPSREVTFKQALINLTMLQRAVNIPHVDGVYWSLFVELSFYFWMYLVFQLKKLQKIEVIGLGLLAFISVYTIAGHVLHKKLPGRYTDFLLLEYGHLFFAGIIFYRIKNYGETNIRHLCLFLCVLVHVLIYGVLSGLIVALFFGLFYLVVYENLPLLSNPVLVFFGTISYSLYLLHQNIGYVIIRYLYQFNLPSIVLLIVPLAIAIALATAVTYTIEKPVMRFIRDKQKQYKTKTI